MTTRRVTYIGLGITGRGMAANLLKRYEVSICNRTMGRAESLREQGASVAASIAEAVHDSDIVMYCLSDHEAVEAIVWGEGGLLASMEPG